MSQQPNRESDVLDKHGRPTSSGPTEAEVQVAHAEGDVFLQLPNEAGTLRLRPEVAKSLGGDLLNEARKAKKQRR